MYVGTAGPLNPNPNFNCYLIASTIVIVNANSCLKNHVRNRLGEPRIFCQPLLSPSDGNSIVLRYSLSGPVTLFSISLLLHSGSSHDEPDQPDCPSNSRLSTESAPFISGRENLELLVHSKHIYFISLLPLLLFYFILMIIFSRVNYILLVKCSSSRKDSLLID